MSKVIRVPVWKDGVPVIDFKPDNYGKDDGAEDDVFTKEREAEFLAEIGKREAELDRLTAEAQTALKIAKEEAEREKAKIMEDAKAEIKALKEESRQKGYEEGLAEGRKKGKDEAKAEMQSAINDANQKAMKTLEDAKTAALDYMDKAENDMAEIILDVAEKIIPQHFLDVPQVVLPAVREALLRIKDQKEISVHVPPDSYDLVLMARDEFRSLLTGGNASLEIVADESLKPGDTLIETESGALDARLSTQLELIRNAVREVMG
ncbi:MAG: flagellar assembly protein FliH [Selenomonadaceae bacterium]|nr:flagellar assembly protein FliH [Selenomonadaceae bacterium]